jgi:hypothetical protein
MCRPCWLYLNSAKHRARWDAPEPPGFLTKALNFAKAAARHVACGLKHVSPAEWSRRVGICQACPLLRDGQYCQHIRCGCLVANKARWESEHCPIGKW